MNYNKVKDLKRHQFRFKFSLNETLLETPRADFPVFSFVLLVYEKNSFDKLKSGRVLFRTWASFSFTPEAYLEPCQTSRMEPFTKIIKSFPLLAIFTESCILDVLQGSEYASVH